MLDHSFWGNLFLAFARLIMYAYAPLPKIPMKSASVVRSGSRQQAVHEGEAHLVGVAAELGNVLLDPVEDHDLVEQTLVTAGSLVRGAKETKGTESENNSVCSVLILFGDISVH